MARGPPRRKFLFGEEYIRCCRCQVWRFRSAFHKSTANKLGVNTYCRRCLGQACRYGRTGSPAENIARMKEIVCP